MVSGRLAAIDFIAFSIGSPTRSSGSVMVSVTCLRPWMKLYTGKGRDGICRIVLVREEFQKIACTQFDDDDVVVVFILL